MLVEVVEIAKVKVGGIAFSLDATEGYYSVVLESGEHTRLVDLLGTDAANERIEKAKTYLEQAFFEKSEFARKAGELRTKLEGRIEQAVRQSNDDDTLKIAKTLMPYVTELLRSDPDFKGKEEYFEGSGGHLLCPIANWAGELKGKVDADPAINETRDQYTAEEMRAKTMDVILELSDRKAVEASFQQAAAVAEKELGSRPQPERLIRIGEHKLASILKDKGVSDAQINDIMQSVAQQLARG